MVTQRRYLHPLHHYNVVYLIVCVMCCYCNAAILTDSSASVIKVHDSIPCYTGILTMSELGNRRTGLDDLDAKKYNNNEQLILKIKDIFELNPCPNYSTFVRIYERSSFSSITIWYSRKVLVTLEPVNQDSVIVNVIDENKLNSENDYPISSTNEIKMTISSTNEILTTTSPSNGIVITTQPTIPETIDNDTSTLPIIIGVTTCVGIMILIFTIYLIWRRKKSNVKSLEKVTVGYDRQIDDKKVDVERMSKAIAHELTRGWEGGVGDLNMQQGTLNEGYQEENASTVREHQERGSLQVGNSPHQNAYVIDERNAYVTNKGNEEDGNIYSDIILDTKEITTTDSRNDTQTRTSSTHHTDNLSKTTDNLTSLSATIDTSDNIYEDVSGQIETNRPQKPKTIEGISNSGFYDEEMYTVPVLNKPEPETIHNQAPEQEYHYVQLDKRGSYTFGDDYTTVQFTTDTSITQNNKHAHKYMDEDGYTVSHVAIKDNSTDMINRDDNQNDNDHINSQNSTIKDNDMVNRDKDRNDDDHIISPKSTISDNEQINVFDTKPLTDDENKTDTNRDSVTNNTDNSTNLRTVNQDLDEEEDNVYDEPCIKPLTNEITIKNINHESDVIKSEEYSYMASPEISKKGVTNKNDKTLSVKNEDCSLENNDFAYVKMY